MYKQAPSATVHTTKRSFKFLPKGKYLVNTYGASGDRPNGKTRVVACQSDYEKNCLWGYN